MTEKFYGTIDQQNKLEMNDPFFHNNWQTGDLLMVTKNNNGTIYFAKVKAEIQYEAK